MGLKISDADKGGGGIVRNRTGARAEHQIRLDD
jgi:hypothetical protein